MKKNNLDQFYTNPIVSDKLVEILFRIMPSTKNKYFLEPSAGTGNFINSLLKHGIDANKIIGYDLEPKSKKIIKANYLEKHIKFQPDRVIIGNPPFGSRGKLALQFLNKSLKESNIVAMILPNILNRYTIQKNVDIDAKLILSSTLKENSFLFEDKEYGVKCIFQVWTKLPTYQKDLRIKEPPKIKHDDFTTWIHNNTKDTLKYFDKNKYKWDFAVHRQGYYNYSEIIENSSDLIKNRQYFFVKAKNKKILKKLKKVNFELLSRTNTQILGFSTSDFVSHYVNMNEERR
ncbi:MAG: hypothetical protein KFW07_01630 [Mycoplasmataceae bacterium]|nr:hypothetical protein [Mycoplasmataceae bacterium]